MFFYCLLSIDKFKVTILFVFFYSLIYIVLILSNTLKVINKPNFIIICINNILHRKSLQQNGGALKK